jgi:Ca-activated chloride channel family protein
MTARKPPEQRAAAPATGGRLEGIAGGAAVVAPPAAAGPGQPPVAANAPPVPGYALAGFDLQVRARRGDEALGGAEVEVRDARGAVRRAVTDRHGIVRFPGLPPGAAHVAGRHPELAAPAPVDVAVAGHGAALALAELAFSGPRPPTLRVRVVVEGAGVPGATVVVRGASGELTAVTDSNGSAAFRDLAPGDYQVAALLEGYHRTTRGVGIGAGARVPLDMTLPLSAGAGAVEYIVVAEPAPGVAGSAARAQGSPHWVGTSAPMEAAPALKQRVAGPERAAAAAPAPPPFLPEPPARLAEVPAPRRRGGTTGGDAEPNDAPYGDVFFQHYGVNPFVDTDDDRLSTFGLDVDTASYTVLRRYLEEGRLPPPDAVRVEEVVNAFAYGDPAPRGGEAFRITVEGAPSPFAQGPRHRLLRFAVRARDIAPEERRPAVLTFVVDASGSMADGDRMGTVKEALSLLLGQLRPSDRVAVVAFADEAWVVLAPTSDPRQARAALAQLFPAGSTNAEAGLALGYHLAWRARRPGTLNRVVLLSDGVANVGATGAGSILARVGAAADDGIELTTVGVGMGNFNDVLLEQLADRGDGRYVYVDDVAEARRVFVEELEGTLETVAEEARAQVEFDPRRVERWRLLGYENRDLADERFRHDDTVDAGEVGGGHTVTVLYEVELAAAAGGGPFALLKLRYRDPRDGRFHEVERRAGAADLAPSWAAAPAALRLAAVAAELAEQLRGSHWARGGSLDEVFREAQAVAAQLPGDARVAELAALAGRAARLAPPPP